MHRIRPIDQQVVVVFGASSGIGREAARRFAERGAKVVVSARSEEGLNTLVDVIRRAGGEATAVVADATDFEQVKAVADKAVEQYGRLDTWAHLAAVLMYATFMDTTPEEFRRLVDVNLMGQVHGAKAALPHLVRSGSGVLIHVSSVEAQRAMPYHSAYAASKHGVHGFIEALRLELDHDNLPVRVSEIMPASINTPLFDKARTKIGVKPRGLPPVYQPSLVADAILHAAEHPVRELVVGGAGHAMLMTQRISPRLMDSFLSLTGFAGQRTPEPRSVDAPDNLYQPIRGLDRVEGRESAVIPSSPGLPLALAASAAIATGVWLAARPYRGGRKEQGTGYRGQGLGERDSEYY